jgi:hypothetical protein
MMFLLNSVWIIFLTSLTMGIWSFITPGLNGQEEIHLVEDCVSAAEQQEMKNVRFFTGNGSHLKFIWNLDRVNGLLYKADAVILWEGGSSSWANCWGEDQYDFRYVNVTRNLRW